MQTPEPTPTSSPSSARVLVDYPVTKAKRYHLALSQDGDIIEASPDLLSLLARLHDRGYDRATLTGRRHNCTLDLATIQDHQIPSYHNTLPPKGA